MCFLVEILSLQINKKRALISTNGGSANCSIRLVLTNLTVRFSFWSGSDVLLAFLPDNADFGPVGDAVTGRSSVALRGENIDANRLFIVADGNDDYSSPLCRMSCVTEAMLISVARVWLSCPRSFSGAWCRNAPTRDWTAVKHEPDPTTLAGVRSTLPAHTEAHAPAGPQQRTSLAIQQKLK